MGSEENNEMSHLQIDNRSITGFKESQGFWAGISREIAWELHRRFQWQVCDVLITMNEQSSMTTTTAAAAGGGGATSSRSRASGAFLTAKATMLSCSERYGEYQRHWRLYKIPAWRNGLAPRNEWYLKWIHAQGGCPIERVTIRRSCVKNSIPNKASCWSM